MKSDQINELATALAKAQGEFKNPQKNKKVNVRTKTGGSYEFEYADFAAIVDAVREPLAKNGLSFVQIGDIEDGHSILITILLHSSGQWLSSKDALLVSPEGGNQNFGSAKTFMKRYALTGILGISADSDDDANAADGNEATVRDRQRKPKEPAPSPIRGGPQAAPVSSVPTAIAVPLGDSGEKDWMAWGRTFMNHAGAATSKIEAGEWLTLNQPNLLKMSQEAPKMFPRLEAALKEVYPKLLLKEGN